MRVPCPPWSPPYARTSSCRPGARSGRSPGSRRAGRPARTTHTGGSSGLRPTGAAAPARPSPRPPPPPRCRRSSSAARARAAASASSRSRAWRSRSASARARLFNRLGRPDRGCGHVLLVPPPLRLFPVPPARARTPRPPPGRAAPAPAARAAPRPAAPRRPPRPSPAPGRTRARQPRSHPRRPHPRTPGTPRRSRTPTAARGVPRPHIQATAPAATPAAVRARQPHGCSRQPRYSVTWPSTDQKQNSAAQIPHATAHVATAMPPTIMMTAPVPIPGPPTGVMRGAGSPRPARCRSVVEPQHGRRLAMPVSTTELEASNPASFSRPRHAAARDGSTQASATAPFARR